MHEMMGGGMAWGSGLLWWLTAIFLILAIAVALKYLFKK
jgi:hypothetical protein